MRTKTLHILYIVLAVCALAACKGDDDDTGNGRPSNSAGLCDIKLDDFSLNSSSTNLNSYENHNSVTFINEAGDKTTYQINKPIQGLFEGIFNEEDTLKYCYATEYIETRLTTQDGLEITIQVEPKPYFADLASAYSADVLKIYYNNIDNNMTDRRMVFRKVLDIKNFPSSLYETTNTTPSQYFINMEFKDVEMTNFNSPIIEVYYNDEVGIVAYKDEARVLWQFDSKS